MKRSCSWPQLNSLEEDGGEDFLSAEVVIETLQQKVSDFQRQSSTSISHIENLNSEMAILQNLNKNLIENDGLSSQQILNLENEKYRLMLQLKKAENLIEVLQQDLEKVDREKSAIFKDLGLQQQAFEIMDNSQKEVEKQIEMFREATARDRDLIESKALEDLVFLTNQLQALELQLKEKEEAALQVETFAIENKKLQIHNKELIKQNMGLERQLKELQERLEFLKGQNQLFSQEVEDMKLQNACGISLNALSYEPRSIRISSATTASNFSILTTQRDEMTPPLLYIQDYDEKTTVSCRSSEDEEQFDLVEEYIRLSVKAVKIHFPNLTVSSERLIEKAKMVPYYKVHDILYSYMRQLEHRESFQKEREKKQPTFVSDRLSCSRFFRCGGVLEYPQNYQCNELRQRWLRKKNRSSIRVRF